MECYTDSKKVGFQFDALYAAVQNINLTCPHAALFFNHASDNVTRLTLAACQAIGQASLQLYPSYDVWVRLVTWKFPLLQLIAQFPRPPLGFRGQVFAIVHLIGNPVNTVYSLLKKLVKCQGIAEGLRKEGGLHDEAWKELALIVISYDESGQGTKAREKLVKKFRKTTGEPSEWKECEKAAENLAADRATKFFPVAIALLLFIGAIAIAIARLVNTPSKPPVNPSTSINVEAHSIAFSALYFYIITAVFLSSLVGASQSEVSIPRILEQLDWLEEKAKEGREGLTYQMTTQDRLEKGGMYSWQPWETKPPDCGLFALAFLLVAIGPLSSMLISWYTPPDGWGCRHCAYASVFSLYVVSVLLDIPFGRRFWWAFWKDLVLGLANLIILGLAQIGIFNSCVCWTRFGKAGLPLPQEQAVYNIIRWRFKAIFLPTAVGCIFVQVFVCGLSCWWFYDAYTVLLQRDDGEDNLSWLWTMLCRQKGKRHQYAPVVEEAERPVDEEAEPPVDGKVQVQPK